MFRAGKKSGNPDVARQRTQVVVVAAVVAAGLSTGAAAGLGASLGSSSAQAEADEKTFEIFDVVHNPPLLVDRSGDVALQFDVVCPSVPCSAPMGRIDVVDALGRVHAYEARSQGSAGKLNFDIPDEVLDAGPVRYSGTFQAEPGAPEFDWPGDGAAMEMRAFTPEFSADLSDMDFSEPESPGAQVAKVRWGSNSDDLRLGREGTEGPTSFDVDGRGNVFVLDALNERIAELGRNGVARSVHVDLARDFPDLAVEDDGAFNILYPNGAGTGSAYVERLSANGRALGRVDLAGRRAEALVLRENRVEATTQGHAMPVVDTDRPLGSAAQGHRAAAGVATADGRVIVKHESGSLVRILHVEESGETASWELRGRENLGPVVLAEPIRGGVLVVQSQFTETDSR